MTKAQIKAELRRSACEDKDPWGFIDMEAFGAASSFADRGLSWLRPKDLRIFYLLVAEAL